MSEESITVPESELRPFTVEQIAPPENVVGMLGFTGSGKSVFSSLFTYYLHNVAKDLAVEPSLEEGFETVRDNMDFFLGQKRFPSRTQPGEVRTIRILLSRKKFVGDKRVLIHVNDIFGEPFEQIVRGNVRDPVQHLLTFQAPQGRPPGPYAFILYAKAYVVTVDCGEYKKWAVQQMDYAKLLNTLVLAKKKEKLEQPLAFVFTKTDMLPVEKQGSSGIDLLEEMSILYDYTKKHFHLHKVECIPVQVGIERDSSGKPLLDERGSHIPKLPLEVPIDGFKSFVEWAFKWL